MLESTRIITISLQKELVGTLFRKSSSGYQLWFSHNKLQEIIEIQIVYPYIILIYGARYFLWKHNTFLAACCTLLSNSYLAIYLQKTTTQKTGKRESRNKHLGRTRTRHLRLDATTPNHYTAVADYVGCRKSLSLYSFSMKLPPAR